MKYYERELAEQRTTIFFYVTKSTTSPERKPACQSGLDQRASIWVEPVVGEKKKKQPPQTGSSTMLQQE